MADTPDANPGGGSGVDPAKVEEVKRTAESLLETGAVQDAMPDEYKYLTEKAQLLEIELKKESSEQEIELRKEYATQEIELRQTYAKGLLALLAVELVFVNVIFWKYAAIGEHWNVPIGVIQIWLGATVVQVVGVVAIVTRYLFPRRDRQPDLPTPPTPPS